MSLEEEIRAGIAKRTYYMNELRSFLQRDLVRFRAAREGRLTNEDLRALEERTEFLAELDAAVEVEESLVRRALSYLEGRRSA